MQDRPTATELAQAVLEFFQGELLPALEEPRLRFRALVAMNALGILARETALGEPLLRHEHARLVTLLEAADDAPSASLEALAARVRELNADLAARIRRGDPPPGAAEHVRQTAREKLMIASPRYLERG